MKVISIQQPWASLIAIGAKQFETRSWATKYRGQIAIHASKKEPIANLRTLPTAIQKLMFDCFYEKFGIDSGAIKNMPIGCIIAITDLKECYEIHEDHSGSAALMLGGVPKVWVGKDSNEFAFGDYSDGRYAWELTDVKQIDPVPAKGQLQIWNYDL